MKTKFIQTEIFGNFGEVVETCDFCPKSLKCGLKTTNYKLCTSCKNDFLRKIEVNNPVFVAPGANQAKKGEK